MRCTEVEGGSKHGADAPRFDSLCVRRAIDGILARGD